MFRQRLKRFRGSPHYCISAARSRRLLAAELKSREEIMIKNLLIAFAVAFVAGFGIAFLEGLSGSPSSSTPAVMPIVLGVLVFFILQMRAGNRKEVRVDDANRQACLSAAVPTGQALLYIYREGFAG